MCGRFSLFAPAGEIEERLGVMVPDGFEPRYNAAPGQSLPVVTGREPGTVERMEWGLVPAWAETRSKFELINARAETVAEKPSFRDAFERRPCVVPADGYYEWAEPADGTEPYRVTLADESVFAMAGIWERWEPTHRQTGLGEFGGRGSERGASGDGVRETFAVATTEANEVVSEVHDRMPVVLDPADASTWLGGSASDRETLLGPYEGRMRAYRVSHAVDDPANDSPAVVEPVAE